MRTQLSPEELLVEALEKQTPDFLLKLLDIAGVCRGIMKFYSSNFEINMY
jgi:hypothetical protein